MRPIPAAFLTLFALLPVACVQTGPREHRASQVADLLVGDFSSAEQARLDPEFRDVVLHARRIWSGPNHPKGTGDAVWLYVEQAMAEAQEKPYRQRVYRISELGGVRAGTVRSDVLEFKDGAERFVNCWKDGCAAIEAIGPEALSSREGCAIELTKDGATGGWTGSTHEQDCVSTLRGASWASSEVVLLPGLLETWDRGFDASGKQVWGAVKGPYRFVRMVD
jgi:hypothetical protein